MIDPGRILTKLCATVLGMPSPAPRVLAFVYAPGVLTLAIDCWVPRNVDLTALYSACIVMCGWLRSRGNLWFATVLFILFSYSDLVIGNPPLFPQEPNWLFLVNRTLFAFVLVLVAIIVNFWIRGGEAAEQYGATLERRVEERSRELEIVSQQRQAAQVALSRAQKLEAVGQLTGGVAHDFNNLLTIIGGNADILRQGASGERQVRRLDAILQAAERGARLTRHLLAFSRRQMLQPEAIDLRERTREVVDMMEQSLQENVRVTVTLADDLWPVEADPAELELAMLNIGINGRDAMPDGGDLSIDARNLTFAAGEDHRNGLVGDFVTIVLTDTGVGIEPQVLERVFDPFFTTKGVGKGSGLGLSQVYGFASQTGGAVSIRSDVGHGTAVTLYLPRAVRPVQRSAIAPVRPIPRGKGRVLYVEDNPQVMEVTQDLLTQIGFEAHGVADAEAALATIDRGESFDILLTDIVMPGGMNGIDLACEIRHRLPALPVLLTSGYCDRTEEARKSGFAVLAKPYVREQLAAALASSVAAEDPRAA